MPKSLRVELISNKNVIVDSIDEFICGFKYFYIRHLDGKMAAFKRSDIREVIRMYPNGMEKKVYLRKIKK